MEDKFMFYLSKHIFCTLITNFQALDWLQQSGDHYLATHTSPGATMAETQELLNQHREFCVSAKVKNAYRQNKSMIGLSVEGSGVKSGSPITALNIVKVHFLNCNLIKFNPGLILKRYRMLMTRLNNHQTVSAHPGEGSPPDPAGREHAG